MKRSRNEIKINSPSINDLIAKIIGSEVGARHHGTDHRISDASPWTSWDIALALHKQVVKRLKKSLKQNRGDTAATSRDEAILQVLTSCSPGALCANAACPLCTHVLQGVMAELVGDLMSVGIRPDATITVVPTLRLPVTDNHEADLTVGIEKVSAFRHKLDRGFTACDITAVFGGLDIGWSELRGGKRKRHGKTHLHALAFRSQVDPARRRLKQHFPNRGSVHRAIFVEDYDSSPKWVTYAFKYPDRRKIRRKDESGKWLEPSYKPLTVDQQLRQLRLFHELGWAARIYLQGVELVEAPRGWRLGVTSRLGPCT